MMFDILLAISFFSSAFASDLPYSFIALGDWGGKKYHVIISGFITMIKLFLVSQLLFSFYMLLIGAAIDSQDYKNVYAVAKQMNITASTVDAKFIINTGDNFYWCGIQNTSDFQIQKDFLEPYNYSSLQLKWYSSLGVNKYTMNDFLSFFLVILMCYKHIYFMVESRVWL